MKTRVTVGDLKQQVGLNIPAEDKGTLLYCRACGAEYSANAGDYWNTPKEHVFKCCKRNMVLARKHMVYENVRN